MNTSNLGVMYLANQAVETIRQAERKSQELEQQTALGAEEIIRSAKERASALTKEAVSRAREQAKEELENAHRQETAVFRQALEQAEQEIAALRETVREREAQTVQTVLAELI